MFTLYELGSARFFGAGGVTIAGAGDFFSFWGRGASPAGAGGLLRRGDGSGEGCGDGAGDFRCGCGATNTGTAGLSLALRGDGSGEGCGDGVGDFLNCKSSSFEFVKENIDRVDSLSTFLALAS